MSPLFWRSAIVLVSGALILGSCTKNELVVRQGPRAATPAATSLSADPEERDPSLMWDWIDHNFRRPLTYLFIPPRALRSWFGEKVEAYNPTAEDDVSDPSWFVHRNSRVRMTPEELLRGHSDDAGPDTSGIWTVVRAKLGGVTPGFTIEDGRGERYIIKFDPPDHEELASAAELISSRLFHAAGYHVPEVFITIFDPSKVRAGESLTFEDALGREHPVSDASLQELLRGRVTRPDGRIRAAASRFLQGTLLGPFKFQGTRDDDPADTIPHQHRRELRGLYVPSAWLNHLDTKQHNTLDVLVEEGGRRYVRHYLIDFGSTLGSRAVSAHTPRQGVESDVELGAIGARWITAGFYNRPWERYEYERPHPSIGFFSADLFDPGSWKPYSPNPAFQNLTVRDGYWGAKLVASFDEAQIRAAVAAGQLSDPQAEEALVQAIIQRRDLTVAYWYQRVTPLEELRVTPAERGNALRFRDLAIAEGVVPAQGRRYDVRFEFPAAGIETRDLREPRISSGGMGELSIPSYDGVAEFWERLSRRPVNKRLAKLEVRALPGPDRPNPRSVRVYLLPTRDEGYRIVGRAY